MALNNELQPHDGHLFRALTIVAGPRILCPVAVARGEARAGPAMRPKGKRPAGACEEEASMSQKKRGGNPIRITLTEDQISDIIQSAAKTRRGLKVESLEDRIAPSAIGAPMFDPSMGDPTPVYNPLQPPSFDSPPVPPLPGDPIPLPTPTGPAPLTDGPTLQDPNAPQLPTPTGPAALTDGPTLDPNHPPLPGIDPNSPAFPGQHDFPTNLNQTPPGPGDITSPGSWRYHE